MPPEKKTLGFHLGKPEISTCDYSRARRFELAAEVLKKKRLYLDQKYWNYCRDALRGRPQKPAHAVIWNLLVDAVREGKAVCPAGYTVFLETGKQQDPASLAATAQVIDTLSKGTVIQPSIVRHEIEVLHALRTLFQGKASVRPLIENVWTFPGFVVGELIPSKTPFEPQVEQALQKTFFDDMASKTFTDLLPVLQTRAGEHDDSALAARLTEDARAHRHDFKTFDQVFDIELRGFLDAIKEEIASSYEYLLERGAVPQELRFRLPRAISAPLYRGVLYAAFVEGKIERTAFPSAHIGASIHAEIRASDRACRTNDTYDFAHACEALPFCTHFFTERSLKATLTVPRLKLDEVYGCVVIASDDEVVASLEALNG